MGNPELFSVETEGSGQKVVGEEAGKIGRYQEAVGLICHAQELKTYDIGEEILSKGCKTRK